MSRHARWAEVGWAARGHGGLDMREHWSAAGELDGLLAPRAAALRAALREQDGRGRRTILVTSAHRREGATTIAMLLCRSLDAGEKVLLLDANLRHPDLHRRFGTDASPGLAEAVRGASDLSSTVRAAGERFFVLPAGAARPSAIQAIMDSTSMTRLLATLKESFDRVVIDAPAALDYPDAIGMAPHCDAVVLVVEANRTKWEVAHEAKQSLLGAGANLLGVVLNKQRQFIPRWLYERV